MDEKNISRRFGGALLNITRDNQMRLKIMKEMSESSAIGKLDRSVEITTDPCFDSIVNCIIASEKEAIDQHR